jgi:CubicO group peptidase (beta-lactamase class C family)
MHRTDPSVSARSIAAARRLAGTLAVTVALSSMAGTHMSAQDAPTIRRLDGSRLSVTTADSIARALVAEHRITGLQLAVVNDGRLAWSAAYGLRTRDPDRPMERTSITWTASITKAVFATYVMTLVERGELDLDRPVHAMLPQPLDSYEPYRTKADSLVHDPRWQRVTPRMLLAHSAGFLNFAQLEPDGRIRIHDEPGRVFRYSGEGLNLLQFVLETARGVPLAAAMDSALFQPLGLRRTAMEYRREFEPDMADRFGQDGAFRAKTRRNSRAAGSLTSTAEELAAFAIALMDGRILPARARRTMLAPQLAIRTHHQFPLPGDDSTASEETARVGLAYGLGWVLLTRTPFGPAFYKQGHGDGAQTHLVCFERHRDCMVILANSDNGEWAFRPLLEQLLGNTVTPWEWEGYTTSYLRAAQGK